MKSRKPALAWGSLVLARLFTIFAATPIARLSCIGIDERMGYFTAKSHAAAVFPVGVQTS